MITAQDTLKIDIPAGIFEQCVQVASHLSSRITDRADLHGRDQLERFNHILMGEIAEQLVIHWLLGQGKFAQSTVDKFSDRPDSGHDIRLKSKDGRDIFCSVKSSLTFSKDEAGIVEEFTLASKASELREVNIQVYFWLKLHPKPHESRISVPSMSQCALIGWFGRKQINSFQHFNHEQRQSPSVRLKEANAMQNLLDYLV
jgi:hypothetical protein